MGTKDRKLREKEELKGLILKAARELFVEKGIENTSIRNIAERIEYSPGTIYLYFKDKDSILHALHTEGFQLLGQQMKVLQYVADPFERLLAMGRMYLQFAKENPEYYQLMFTIRGPMNVVESDACWVEGQTTFDILVHVVQECIDAGRFKGHDARNLSFVIWSAVHGMVVLSEGERCKVVSEEQDIDKIQEIGLEALQMLLKTS